MHGSTLAAVCLRRVSEPSAAEQASWGTLKRFLDMGLDGSYEVIVERIAGETAYRYEVVVNSRPLIEWKFVHAGWLFVVGVLNCALEEEQQATVQRARAALDTWEWLPGPIRAGSS
jgi:hypothetical protein